MFPPDLFAGQRYAVLGLGRNGAPAARALASMGAEVVAWDDLAENRAPVPGVTLRDPAEGAFHYDALVLSPGIPHTFPAPHPVAARALAAGVPVLSDAELLFQAARRAGSHARFAGITGTNGKSTTTALLAHILSVAGIPNAAGGNLGTASLALPLLGDDGVYVLEMSSYMLERLATLRFDAATMLNISPDHLDRHGGMEGYVAAKRRVFDRQDAECLAVTGTDDDASRAMAAWLDQRTARVARISATQPIGVDAPSLPGAHNAQNAAAARAMAAFLGASDAAINEGLRNFPGLPHRQQRVGIVDRVAYVNDSKATNADAAARAMSCYDDFIWIAGGVGKEGGIEPLAPYFPRIAHALLIGRDGPAFAATLDAHGVPYSVAGTLEEAVAAAPVLAAATGARVVLLSPAAASFDQFSGFDARGDRFASLVAALGQERAA